MRRTHQRKGWVWPGSAGEIVKAISADAVTKHIQGMAMTKHDVKDGYCTNLSGVFH